MVSSKYVRFPCVAHRGYLIYYYNIPWTIFLVTRGVTCMLVENISIGYTTRKSCRSEFYSPKARREQIAFSYTDSEFLQPTYTLAWGMETRLIPYSDEKGTSECTASDCNVCAAIRVAA